MAQYKEGGQTIVSLVSEMGLHFLHKHTHFSSSITQYSPVLSPQSLLGGLIPSRALWGRQVQASVSTLCHLCHLQPPTHFTTSPIWCQQLQTVSLGPAVSSGRQISTVLSGSCHHFTPSFGWERSQVWVPKGDWFSENVVTIGEHILSSVTFFCPICLQGELRSSVLNRITRCCGFLLFRHCVLLNRLQIKLLWWKTSV